MKHCIFILLFSIGVVINCYSQASHSLHIGPHLGIPSNNLGNASLGFGGSVEYNLKFRGPIGGQFHLGYSRFSNKSISDQEVTFLPIRIGAIAYIYEEIFFINADAGISRYSSKSTGTKQSGFTLGIGTGYRQPLTGGQFVQFSAYFNLHHFEGATGARGYNYSWFNIRAAYGLSWGRKKLK